MLPSKVHDEVISREIVINDADPGVRYKLTKRQTQEEVWFYPFSPFLKWINVVQRERVNFLRCVVSPYASSSESV